MESNIKTETITVEEAAKRLNISRTLAYQLANKGELPGVIRLGGRFIVARAVLDRVLGVDPGATQ